MSASASCADDSGHQLKRSLVLVGLMGAGKSTIGRRLAQMLSVPFIDSDNEIVSAAGCSIADIFEIHGEAIFRDLEQRVLLRLLESNGSAVIATGGGAFLNPVIRDAVRQHSVSVWLKADLEVLLERVSRKRTRPLLERGDKRAILARLIEERHAVYAKADVTVDSSAGLHHAVVEEIVKILTKRGDYA